MTRHQIAVNLPEIRLFECAAEDIPVNETFDMVALHSVTGHLVKLEAVFKGLVDLCHPRTRTVFLHHKFYSRNGHGFQPKQSHELELKHPEHLQICDWDHIDTADGLPKDHYFRVSLNGVHIYELWTITERFFQVLFWNEISSLKETLNRLTPEIINSVRKAASDIEERRLTTIVAYCAVKPKQSCA